MATNRTRLKQPTPSVQPAGAPDASRLSRTAIAPSIAAIASADNTNPTVNAQRTPFGVRCFCFRSFLSRLLFARQALEFIGKKQS